MPPSIHQRRSLADMELSEKRNVASLRPQVGEKVLRFKFSFGSHRHRIVVVTTTRAGGVISEVPTAAEKFGRKALMRAIMR